MLRKLFEVRVVPMFFALALLIISTVNHTAAQETFVPLISDSCLGFVHIDLRKIDLDKIRTLADQSTKDFLTELKFDQKSFDATTRELKIEADKIDRIVRPKFDLFTKKLGITEIAVIIDEQFHAPVVAVSWKNKTEADLQILKSLFEVLDIPFPFACRSGDFLLLSEQELKRIVDAKSDDVVIVPSKNSVIFEALKEAGNDEIKVAFALNEKLRKTLIEQLQDQITSDAVRGLVTFFLHKVDWGVASLSLGRVVSDTKKESIKITFKTSKASDAVFLRNAIEGSIDNAIFLAKRMPIDEAGNLNVVYELLGGFMRRLLPDVNGNRLTLSFTSDDWSFGGARVVVAGAGIGTGLLLPAVQSAREAARRMQCTNNIRQIVLAFHCHHDVYKTFPPLYTVDAAGKPLHSWRVAILPFIEQGSLYDKIRHNESWDSEYNKQFHKALIPVYSCPSVKFTDENKRCSYAVIAGQPLVPKKGVAIDKIPDGTSNTVSVVEVKEPFCWMDPKADITLEDFVKGINSKDGVVGSQHIKGANVGLWDGSSKFLDNSTTPAVLKAIGTANGGEAVAIP
ncbi:MAG: DUF1559 domain-containing protein [Planctomycetaceae bacterium]|jgi:hypothetical protein|nr:DUF1559 domain-containing protein [Planctomycetaceae bacterium]